MTWGYVAVAAATVVAAAVSSDSSRKASNTAADAAKYSAKTAADIPTQQWNYYKDNYMPVETSLIDNAQNAGSQDEYKRAEGAANADVTNSFDQAQKQTQSRLQSYGINPASPAYQSATGSVDLAEGASKAGAMTAADNSTRQLAYSKQLDVAGLGRNIPAQSSASLANASALQLAQNKNSFYQNQQNQVANGRGIQAIGQLGSQAYNWYNNSNSNPTPGGAGSSMPAGYYGSGGQGNIGTTGYYGTAETDALAGAGALADGGKVSRYASGGLVADEPSKEVLDGLKQRLMDRGIGEDDAEQAHQSAKKKYKNGGPITPHMKMKPLGYAKGGAISDQGLDAQEPQEQQDASEMGKLDGPGTETSDSIPAQIDGKQPAALSTGEVVMNASAVKLSGEDILNAINKAGLQARKKQPQPQEADQEEPMPQQQTAFKKGGKVKNRYATSGLGA